MPRCNPCWQKAIADIELAPCSRQQDSTTGPAASGNLHDEQIAEGEVRNPLKDIPKEQLLERVKAFQKEKGLPDDIADLLQKGALVAQNPANFENIHELDENEKQALREEKTNRWKHPWPLYYTIVLSSIAAAIQGWDQVRVTPTCRHLLQFAFSASASRTPPALS